MQKINKAVIKQRKKADCGYFNSSKWLNQDSLYTLIHSFIQIYYYELEFIIIKKFFM